MEKTLSLSYEEADALLEAALFSYIDKGAAADSALSKLGDLCREFSAEENSITRMPVSEELASIDNGTPVAA